MQWDLPNYAAMKALLLRRLAIPTLAFVVAATSGLMVLVAMHHDDTQPHASVIQDPVTKEDILDRDMSQERFFRIITPQMTEKEIVRILGNPNASVTDPHIPGVEQLFWRGQRNVVVVHIDGKGRQVVTRQIWGLKSPTGVQ